MAHAASATDRYATGPWLNPGEPHLGRSSKLAPTISRLVGRFASNSRNAWQNTNGLAIRGPAVILKVRGAKRRASKGGLTMKGGVSRTAGPRRAGRGSLLFLDLRLFGLLLGRGQAFQALEQLFLRHAVRRNLGVIGIDPLAGTADERHRLGLRLVHLDVLLERVDEIFLEIAGGDRLVGDFAQGHDRVLVVVAIHGDLRARGDHAPPMARQQHQVETVLDLVDTIFHGDTGHGLVTPLASSLWKSCR